MAGLILEAPTYVEVMKYDSYLAPDNFMVELIVESTRLSMGYCISKERANDLAGRVAKRFGIEVKLAE